MIKARIRWCTCRVENILTLGKLLSLWFCFLLHSILFLISQTSYRTYKIISRYELARPIMGTIFLVMIKARIRWCTCRVENILTLGKLLSLWFCFLLHSILFLISQTSYRTYKIISRYELARPIMGTIFLVTQRHTFTKPALLGGSGFPLTLLATRTIMWRSLSQH